MTDITYTASDRQLIAQNGGTLPGLPPPSTATRTLERVATSVAETERRLTAGQQGLADQQKRLKWQLLAAIDLMQKAGFEPDSYDVLLAAFVALQDADLGISSPLFLPKHPTGGFLTSADHMMRATFVVAVMARAKRDACPETEARKHFLRDLSDKLGHAPKMASIFPERQSKKENEADRRCQCLKTWDSGFKSGRATGLSSSDGGHGYALQHYQTLIGFLEAAGQLNKHSEAYETLLGWSTKRAQACL